MKGTVAMVTCSRETLFTSQLRAEPCLFSFQKVMFESHLGESKWSRDLGGGE